MWSTLEAFIFLQNLLIPFLLIQGDVVYLSPPWGGPEYSKVDTYDLRAMLKPQNGLVVFISVVEAAYLSGASYQCNLCIWLSGMYYLR